MQAVFSAFRIVNHFHSGFRGNQFPKSEGHKHSDSLVLCFLKANFAQIQRFQEKGFPRVTAPTKIFSVFQILTGIDALKQATLMLYVTVMTDFFHQLTKWRSVITVCCTVTDRGAFVTMKKNILAFAAITAVCMSLTACKSNEENNTNQYPTAPYASEIPNANQGGDMPSNNGFVTDTNGIIGDADDAASAQDKQNDQNPVSNAAKRAGDTVDNAADKIGETAKNLADNAGNIVSNVTSNVGDGISEIADNAGDIFKNTTDNASKAADNE